MSVNYALDPRYGGCWYLASAGEYCWTCNHVNCEATYLISQKAVINTHVREMHAGVAPESPNLGFMPSSLQLSQVPQPQKQEPAFDPYAHKQELPSLVFDDHAGAQVPVGQYSPSPRGHSSHPSSANSSARNSPSASAASRHEERRISNPQPSPGPTFLEVSTPDHERNLRRLAEARALCNPQSSPGINFPQILTTDHDRNLRCLAEARVGVDTHTVRQPRERIWIWDAQLGNRAENSSGEMRWVCHLCGDGNDRKASQDGVQRHLREYHEVFTTVRAPLQET